MLLSTKIALIFPSKPHVELFRRYAVRSMNTIEARKGKNQKADTYIKANVTPEPVALLRLRGL